MVNYTAEELMVGVISQHLLSAELQAVEGQLARATTPLGQAEAQMRMLAQSSRNETAADCQHLEVTLQAARCESTAADTALQSALQQGDDLLREATQRLFLAQDELALVGGPEAMAVITAAAAAQGALRSSMRRPTFCWDDMLSQTRVLKVSLQPREVAGGDERAGDRTVTLRIAPV